jgi:hypothetical protein
MQRRCFLFCTAAMTGTRQIVHDIKIKNGIRRQLQGCALGRPGLREQDGRLRRCCTGRCLYTDVPESEAEGSAAFE